MKRAVRGDPVRTVRGREIQREVAEYILTKQAGLTRRGIYGERRRGRHVERRHDIAAAVRRALAACGRRRVSVGVGASFAFVGVTAALAGFTAAAIFMIGVAVVAAAAVDRYVPDVMFEAPPPKATVTTSTTPGMSDKEFHRRLAIHAERENLREEQIERRRRRQQAKAKSGRRTF